MTTILDGTPLARSIREHTSHAAGTLAAHRRPPKLAVVVATDDERARYLWSVIVRDLACRVITVAGAITRQRPAGA